MSPVMLNFMKGLLEKDPEKRLSAQEALEHQYFTEEDVNTEQTRKKADSWTNSQQIEEETVADNEIIDASSPNRRRAATSQQKNICQFQQSAKEQEIEIAGINSFSNVVSQELVNSFHHNAYNMFQSTIISTAAKIGTNYLINENGSSQNNIEIPQRKTSIDLTLNQSGKKLTIECGQTSHGRIPSLEYANSPLDVQNSFDFKKQNQLNQVQEVEDETESPNLMKQQNKSQFSKMSQLTDKLDKSSETDKYLGILKLNRLSTIHSVNHHQKEDYTSDNEDLEKSVNQNDSQSKDKISKEKNKIDKQIQQQNS